MAWKELGCQRVLDHWTLVSASIYVPTNLQPTSTATMSWVRQRSDSHGAPLPRIGVDSVANRGLRGSQRNQPPELPGLDPDLMVVLPLFGPRAGVSVVHGRPAPSSCFSLPGAYSRRARGTPCPGLRPPCKIFMPSQACPCVPRRGPTAREKCLLHLLQTFFTARATEQSRHEAPFAITQEGIAQALWIGRNNVSRLVRRLIARGWVEARRGRVLGFRTKKMVYYLTYDGLLQAKRIKAALEHQGLKVIKLDGGITEATIEDIPSLLGMRVPLVEILHHLSEGTFDCRRYLEARDRALNKGGPPRLPRLKHFYGREALLRELAASLERPGFQCVVIQGIAGVGKTSLAVAYYAGTKVTALYLRISPWTTLRGLVHAVASFCLRHGEASLFLHLSQHATLGLEETLAACAQDLSRIGAHVVLEDFHNAPAEVASFTRGLLELPGEPKDFKLVILSREVPRIYSRARAKVHGEVRELLVDGLGRAESMELMRDLGLPLTLFDDIYRVTRGHPLLIELTAVAGFPRAADLTSFVEEEVLASLRPQELRILHRAALYRRPVPARALVPAAHLPFLNALSAKALVRDLDDGSYELHDLLREAILRRLSQEERREGHSLAVEFYAQEEDLGSKLEAAYHLLEVGDQERASRELVGHQEEFIGSAYTRELHGLVGRINVRMLPAPLAAQVLLLQGSLAVVEGEWPRAQELLSWAEASARAVGDRFTIGRSLRALGDLAISRGEFGEAAEFLDEAKRITEESGDTPGLTATHYLLGSAYEKLGELTKAREHFTRGLTLAEEIGDDLEIGKSWYAFGRLDARFGKHDSAVREEQTALDYLQRTGDLIQLAKVHTGLGANLCYLGRIKEGIEHHMKAVELAERTGELRILAHGLSNLAMAWYDAGDPSQSEALLEKALAITNRLGERWLTAHIYLDLAEVASASGKVDQGKVLLEEAILRFSRDVGPFDAARAFINAGGTYNSMGLPDQSVVCLKHALRLSQENHFGELMAKAEALLGAHPP